MAKERKAKITISDRNNYFNKLASELVLKAYRLHGTTDIRALFPSKKKEK